MSFPHIINGACLPAAIVSGTWNLPELMSSNDLTQRHVSRNPSQYGDRLSRYGMPILKIYIYNGNAYTGKTTYLYWQGLQDARDPSYGREGDLPYLVLNRDLGTAEDFGAKGGDLRVDDWYVLEYNLWFAIPYQLSRCWQNDHDNKMFNVINTKRHRRLLLSSRSNNTS